MPETTSANTILSEATRLYNEKKFSEALIKVNEAALLHPDSKEVKALRAPIYVELGNILYQGGDYAGAKADYLRSLEDDPNYPSALYNLVLANINLKLPQDAIDAAQKLRQVSPVFAIAPSVSNWIGNYYFNEKANYEQAIQWYDLAIAEDPKTDYAYRNKGLAYERLEQFPKAIDNYQQAIAINENYAEAYKRLAIAYEKIKDYDRAIASYEQAVSRSPSFANLNIDEGNIYFNEKKDYLKAIELYQRAVTANSFSHLALRNIGLAYEKMDDRAKAIEYYRKAIEAKPDYYEAYKSVGSAYEASGDVDKAIEFYGKAADQDDNRFGDLYIDIGNIYFNQKKDYLQAIAYYNKAIAANASPHIAFRNTGLAYEQLQDWDRAKEYYRKATQADPLYADAFANLGYIYMQYKMDYPKAVECYQKVISLSQDRTNAYHNMAWIMEKTGRFQESKQYWKQALDGYEQEIIEGEKEQSRPVQAKREEDTTTSKAVNASASISSSK